MGGSIDIIGHLGSAVRKQTSIQSLLESDYVCFSQAGDVPAFDIIRPSIGKQLNIRGVFVGSVAQ